MHSKLVDQGWWERDGSSSRAGLGFDEHDPAVAA
jgi:hypothetical protein